MDEFNKHSFTLSQTHFNKDFHTLGKFSLWNWQWLCLFMSDLDMIQFYYSSSLFCSPLYSIYSEALAGVLFLWVGWMVKGPWAVQGPCIVLGIINTLVRAFILLVGKTKAGNGMYFTKYIFPFHFVSFFLPLHLSLFCILCHYIKSFHFLPATNSYP